MSSGQRVRSLGIFRIVLKNADVGMGADEARDDCLSRTIDYPGVGRLTRGRGGSALDEPFPHDHVHVGTGRRSRTVDQRRVPQHRGLLGRQLRRRCHQAEQAKPEFQATSFMFSDATEYGTRPSCSFSVSSAAATPQEDLHRPWAAGARIASSVYGGVFAHHAWAQAMP
jgi:hypothetical protein